MTIEQLKAQMKTTAKPKGPRTDYSAGIYNNVTYVANETQSATEVAIEVASMDYVLADLKKSNVDMDTITDELFAKLVTDKSAVINNSIATRSAGLSLRERFLANKGGK